MMAEKIDGRREFQCKHTLTWSSHRVYISTLHLIDLSL